MLTPSSNRAGGQPPGDVLRALAMNLAANTAQTGRKALALIRARSAELVRMSDETGEDLIATSGGFIEVLRCKRGDGKKVAGNEAGIAVGTILGN